MTFYNDIYVFYPMKRTPFIFDTSLLTIILVFAVIAFTFLLVVPGIRGKLRFFWMSRLLLSLFIGGVIVAVNFSSSWASVRVSTNTTYKAFSRASVSAEVGLHIGLTGINVTLKGTPVRQLNETINYNEVFRWTGSFEEAYAEALERGLPNPILYIAEKFTLNSPCGFYYQYRYSGTFASATMWTAFCCWLLANILFCMPVILYAGFMMLATAVFMFFSLASFSTIYNVPSCPFTVGSATFQATYSHSFWLVLATSLLCSIIGILIMALDSFFPEKMKEIFSVNEDDDEDMALITEGYLNRNFLVNPVPISTLTFGNIGKAEETLKHCV